MRCASALAVLLLFAWPGPASQQDASSEIQSAIQEFKVRTRSLGLRTDSPRKGRRKNGRSASWHGRVFWNLRNDILDAVPHEVTQTVGDKGILRRGQYGFNIAGPVVIPKLFHGGNRTFFSLTYEGMRETIGRSYLLTVPTNPERSGNFGGVVDKSGDLLPIYDPATTRPNPGFDPDQKVSLGNLQYLREPFPLNSMPVARMDPAAQDAMQYYPRSNASIGPFFENNYSVYSPEVNKADGIRAKLDHAVRESHRLSFGLAFSNGFAGPAKYYDTIANPGGADREYWSRRGSVEHVFTLSPNSINTARFTAWTSGSESGVESDSLGQPFPVLRFGPYLSMGRTYPARRSARADYLVSNGFSTSRGKHSLRFNGNWRMRQANSYLPQYPSGRFDFSDGLTSLPGIVNTGHAFPSFLLGLGKGAEASLVEHPSYFRNSRGELSVRDEWDIATGITLYLGLTLNIGTPRVEKYDRQSTVDLTAINPENQMPGALVFAARDGTGRSFQPVRLTPEPNLTLAWSPFGSSKSVVRISVRRSYGSLSLSSGQWGTQGFNGTPTYITQNAQLEPAFVFSEGLPPPPNLPPDLRPEAVNDTIADLVEPTGLLPSYDSASLTVERQFPGMVVMSIGASHTRGRNIFAGNDSVNLNAISLDALEYRDDLNEEEFNKSLRPYPQYQRFDIRGSYPIGRYERNSSYLRLEKRTSQGLSLRARYQYSKQMDDFYARGGLQDYYHREKEWSMTHWNDPHTLSLSYMYELPFGPNKPFLAVVGWRRHLVEGWSVSGMTSYSSGDPISLEADFNNTGNVVDTLYVNAVPGVDPHVEDRGPELWFNPAAFINPPDFTIGNMSRTHPALRNPSQRNHDLSVTKRFSLGPDRAVEFSAVGLNFTNQADWNRPDAEIGSEKSPNLNAGKITGSRGGRVIQVGLRFTF